MKFFSIFFIVVIVIFSMFLIFFDLNLSKTIYAQKACCFEAKEDKIKLLHTQEKNHHSILINLFLSRTNKIQGLFSMVKNDPLESRSTRKIKSNYSKYLISTVD
jgi:hypothetical protein